MYTSSNVYGNAVTLYSVSMIERVVFVGIDTYYDFESIWTINSLESHKHHDRQLSTTRNQSVVTLSFCDCWQITVDVFFWLEESWYCISNADCGTMVWRKRDECYSDGCIQVRDAWAATHHGVESVYASNIAPLVPTRILKYILYAIEIPIL